MPRPKLSFACPPGGRSVENSKIAEKLGYERAWLFDSPSLYTDIWISLARIADATERIGFGTGVAVPSMRHPMVTASAIAAVEGLAPGRLVVAFGTGFTARVAMGQKSMTWTALTEDTRQVGKLFDGAVVRGSRAAEPDRRSALGRAFRS